MFNPLQLISVSFSLFQCKFPRAMARLISDFREAAYALTLYSVIDGFGKSLIFHNAYRFARMEFHAFAAPGMLYSALQHPICKRIALDDYLILVHIGV